MTPPAAAQRFVRRIRAGSPRGFVVVSLLAAALGLTGCIDTLEGSQRRQVNAPGVPVALVSVEGAPDAVVTRFQSALAGEAQRREIGLVQGSEAPRYKMKGYLSAYETEGGTALAWVWDMYDTTEKRAKRLDGAQIVKREGAEPWAVVDDAALQRAAANGMNEVAAYLTGSTTAAAVVSSSQAGAARPAPARNQPVLAGARPGADRPLRRHRLRPCPGSVADAGDRTGPAGPVGTRHLPGTPAPGPHLCFVRNMPPNKPAR